MEEGRYKTNIKPPYFECGSCGYRAPDYKFTHGMWWWKKIHCPVCKSVVVEVAVRKSAPPPPIKRTFSITIEDKKHLQFIYNRMANFHLENQNYDYMLRFKEIIDKNK